jgi:uncharacterized lipoprotein YddW (UPF0748 family)
MKNCRCRLGAAALLIAAVGLAECTAQAEKPFMGAYMNVSDLFRSKADQAARERSIAENLDQFRDAGLRVLIPFVTSTDGKAFYPSRLIPTTPYRQWDPLAVMVREARQRGLQIYPAMCVLACGHDRPSGILKVHPDWALRGKEGQPLGFISSGHPEARAWVVAVLKEIAATYRPDGILLDYCRYPGNEALMDPVSQAKFDESHPAGPFPPGSRAYKEELLKFKRQCLTELVGQISGTLRALEPRPRIAAYMWGAQELPGSRDWRTWAARGYLDMLNLTGYCYREQYGDQYLKVLDDRFRDVAAILKDVHQPVEFTICVGIDTSHGKIRAAREIEDYLQIGKRHGVQGASIFTWHTLQPYLGEVKKAGYFAQFEAGLPPVPKP